MHGANEWLFLERKVMPQFLLSTTKLLSESQRANFLVGKPTKSLGLGVQCQWWSLNVSYSYSSLQISFSDRERKQKRSTEKLLKSQHAQQKTLSWHSIKICLPWVTRTSSGEDTISNNCLKILSSVVNILFHCRIMVMCWVNVQRFGKSISVSFKELLIN